MKTGIYQIRNIINDDSYIGSAKDINRRWQRHKSALKHNHHENIHLQRAWNKYGEKNFIFEILEECLYENLLATEQKYLDLNPKYNIGKTSSGGDNLTNHPDRENIIKKIGDAARKRMKELSSSDRILQYSRPMEDNPNWKGGKTYNFCTCGIRISYNSLTCNTCGKKYGIDNPFYNKHHTKETKKLLSEQRIGKYNGKQNKPIVIDNIEYRSAGEASTSLGIPMVTIRWRVLSKNKKFNNYQYKDI